MTHDTKHAKRCREFVDAMGRYTIISICDKLGCDKDMINYCVPLHGDIDLCTDCLFEVAEKIQASQHVYQE